MTISPRQVVGILVLFAVGFLGVFFARDAAIWIVPVVLVATTMIGFSAGGRSRVETGALIEAVRRAMDGERPIAPPDAAPELRPFYEELSRVASRSLVAVDEAKRAVGDHDATLADTIRKAASGERLTVSGSGAAFAKQLPRAWDELAAFAEQRARERTEGDLAVARLAESDMLVEEVATKAMDLSARGAELIEQASRGARELAGRASETTKELDSLTRATEQSAELSVSLGTTSADVAKTVSDLVSDVRETVGAMEGMAMSLREVAKNVDALSLTAEETSSSMNEIDISIDQVQSNANETARLSEEVALDAEKGAEAILKTLGEINRIKESSLEAVAVISSLGSRIEAIGQIVNVIDDVAEQTNLLALNAAIIAAQAGEQGKGFAVVADEIKDLAERAGTSTREITDLIKTVQSESKNAIMAVERGAANVDRGVEVSNEAERALKKILESSRQSTNMVRAIARATVEQAKGSKQVTDSIGRIAETVQQVAATTAEQARGSDQVFRSTEKIRTATLQVERASEEQARGGRQLSSAFESIGRNLGHLQTAVRAQALTGEQLAGAIAAHEGPMRAVEAGLRRAAHAAERPRRSHGKA